MKNAQEVQLDVIESVGQRNSFDGPSVVQSLNMNRSLWKAVMVKMDMCDLIPLRDMEDGVFNADTLYLIPADGKDAHLEALALRWGADEVDWLDERTASHRLGGGRKKVLRVWWD